MPTFSEALNDLLRSQDGVLRRGQLLAHGVSKEAIRWNTGRSWRVLLPSTYLVEGSEITLRRRHIASLLYAGPGAVITGAAGAAHHGLREVPGGQGVEVVVPPTRRRRSVGFVTVRPSLVVDAESVSRGPLTYASVGRCCVDTAMSLRSARGAEALFIEAVQKGLVHPDQLAEWIFRLRSRDTALLQEALRSSATGVWSLPERRLVDLMSTSAILPRPWPNPTIEDSLGLPLLTPDLWFDEVAFAVMVHSRRHHSQGDQWDDTVARDAGLVAAGIVVVGVTPKQIDRDPVGVRARIEASFLTAQRRPRPEVTAYDREGWIRLSA